MSSTLGSISSVRGCTEEEVAKYSSFGIEGTSWLAFRDIPELVKKYRIGPKTLDYGCGSGRSTRFLKSLSLSPIGADICPKFLKEALQHNDDLDYLFIKNSEVPVIDEYFDFVFSSFVLLMVPSRNEMIAILGEIRRVMKDGAYFVILTGSEEIHRPDRDWVSYETDFVENYRLGSGSVSKLRIREAGMTFTDYNWLNEDYIQAIKDSGFELLETFSPLGKETDPIRWKMETSYSPYTVYVLRK